MDKQEENAINELTKSIIALVGLFNKMITYQFILIRAITKLIEIESEES